ncbi:MAG: aminoacyl-tRNA hydrolase [Chloroflexi bacterium]|nr:aminoacyl-tRNA hydrolase [Chloroflexota bacterium]
MAKVLDWLSGKGKHEPKDPPLLLVGIGNPGEKYKGTRHNIGFRCIDIIAERAGIRLNDKRKDVELAQGTIAGRAIVLAKPRTFVNKSGVAARYLATRFGTKPPGMLVLIDDLDLPVGTMRLRASGGSGGHNGLNSINADLGTQDYPRLRVGISRPTSGAIAHVLGGFSKQEEELMVETLTRAAEAAEAWAEHGIEYAMNQFN